MFGCLFVALKVDSVNKHGTLLEVVQVLTDMNLVIKKAYISSDGGWFMDVFKVIDQDGNKIRDTQVLDYIQRVCSHVFSCSINLVFFSFLLCVKRLLELLRRG